MTPLYFGSKIMHILVFLQCLAEKMYLCPNSMGFICGGVGRALYALVGLFCYVGGFGDLSDPVVPTLRGGSADVVTLYAY